MACDKKLENLLLDEDNLVENLNGTLTFGDGSLSLLSEIKDSLSLSSVSVSPPITPTNENPRLCASNFKLYTNMCDIKFEVIDTCIVGENKNKHVEYTILLMNMIGLDSMPAKIVKRYSELNSLRRSLNQLDHDFVANIPFPSKKIIGNFTADTLLERSKSFEKFLALIFFNKKLRYSRTFLNFLYGFDALEGYRLIENGLYEKAADLLVSCWKVQSKVFPVKSIHSCMMLISIVACYCSFNACDQAIIYADLAVLNFPELPQIPSLSLSSTSSNSSPLPSSRIKTGPLLLSSSSVSSTSSSLTSSLNISFDSWFITLLRTSIKVCSSLSKDSRQYERRIFHLQKLGYDVDSKESLLEMILHNKALWLNLVLGDDGSGSN